MNKRMKIGLSGATALLALGCAGFGASQKLVHADATAASTPATITVIGHSDQQVAPDVATIDAGVTTKADDAQTAQQQNDAAMKALMSALQNAGIPAGNIHTQWYSIAPDYGNPDKNGQPTMTGFRANDNIEVVLKDLSKVGDTVDLLVKSGANQINNVSYQVSNPLQVQTQLYDAALADAKSQAQHIASSLGVSITGVRSVDSTQSGGGPIIMNAKMAASSAPISPGTQDIGCNVTVVYTIGN